MLPLARTANYDVMSCVECNDLISLQNGKQASNKSQLNNTKFIELKINKTIL